MFVAMWSLEPRGSQGSYGVVPFARAGVGRHSKMQGALVGVCVAASSAETGRRSVDVWVKPGPYF